MPRYQGDPLGDARNDGQVPKYKDEGARREEPEKGYRTRTSGPSPDIRPLKMSTTAAAQPSKCYRARTSGPMPRTSGSSRSPENPASCPDIRPRLSREHRTPPHQPRHSAPSPDIRLHPTQRAPVSAKSARTSGPSQVAGNPAPHHRSWTLPARTSGPSARTSGVSGRPGHPAPSACVQRIWAEAHVPLRPLDYIYSPTSS